MLNLKHYCQLFTALALLLAPSALHAQDRDGAFGEVFAKPRAEQEQTKHLDPSRRVGGAQVSRFVEGTPMHIGRHYQADIAFTDGRWRVPGTLLAPQNAEHVSLLWQNGHRFPRFSRGEEGDRLSCVFTVLDIVVQCLLPPCKNGPTDATYVLEIESIR